MFVQSETVLQKFVHLEVKGMVKVRRSLPFFTLNQFTLKVQQSPIMLRYQVVTDRRCHNVTVSQSNGVKDYRCNGVTMQRYH